MDSATSKKLCDTMDVAEVTFQDLEENQKQAVASQTCNKMLNPEDEQNLEEDSNAESVMKPEAAIDLKEEEKELTQDVGAGRKYAEESGKPGPRINFPASEVLFLECQRCNVFNTTNCVEWIKHVEECQL